MRRTREAVDWGMLAADHRTQTRSGEEPPLEEAVAACLAGVARASRSFVCMDTSSPNGLEVVCAQNGVRTSIRYAASIWEVFGLEHSRELQTPNPSGRYFREHSAPLGFVGALAVTFRGPTNDWAVAGIERTADELPFSTRDGEAIVALLPLISAAVEARARAPEPELEVLALRALEDSCGCLLVVDLDQRRVVWESASARKQHWRSGDREETVISEAERLLDSRRASCPGPAVVPKSILSVTPMPMKKVAGHRRCVVVRLLPEGEVDSELRGLSPREREVARLLAAGFSHVNIGAQFGLSTHTVRTYIRRLYRKLGVFNRAELVRRLVALR